MIIFGRILDCKFGFVDGMACWLGIVVIIKFLKSISDVAEFCSYFAIRSFNLRLI